MQMGTDQEIHASDTRYHGRIDWDIAKRHLEILYLEGPIKRTSLAMKAGINYSASARYLSWLAEIGWIMMLDSGRAALTEPGIAIHKKLESA